MGSDRRFQPKVHFRSLSFGAVLTFMGLFVFSCGKERTLTVNEKWSTELPIQADQSKISFDVVEDFSASPVFRARLSYAPSVAATTSCDTSKKMAAEIAGLSFSLPGSCKESSQQILEISSAQLSAMNAATLSIKLGDQTTPVALPALIFQGSFFEENLALCYVGFNANNSLLWRNSSDSSLVVSSSPYRNEIADTGTWAPGIDFLQLLVPDLAINPTVPRITKVIPITLSRVRAQLASDPLMAAESKKQIRIEVTTSGLFQTSFSSKCE